MTSLGICCALLFCLLGAIESKPNLDPKISVKLDEIMFKLQHLRNKTRNITPLFPKLNTEKSLTVEELACRGLQSLRAVSDHTEEFTELKSALSRLANKVKCVVDFEEKYDLASALNELFRAFQRHQLAALSPAP